ncbi:cytochrome P450 [Mycena capillaripes]|nr:cytochrome P450 [Mycena capillaripes]
MDGVDIKTVLLCGLAAAISIVWLRSREKVQSSIPAIIGSKGPISSYLGAIYFLRNATEVVQQGYYKHPDGVFRVPTLFHWEYVVNEPQRIAEEGVSDTLQTDYTMGPEITKNHYHGLAVRGSLTRNLDRCFPEVRHEIVHAFDDVLALESKEWKLLHVLPNIMQIVARTSNRLFVGLPLCREQEYLDLNIDYTATIFIRGQIIGLLPGFLKPILGPFISTRKSSTRHALNGMPLWHNPSIISDRLEKEKEYGRDWPERPNDLISWLLDLAVGEERTVPDLTLRILAINMAAIHTTSQTLTAALYDLTTYPEHLIPMCEEAERVVAAEGWSKASLANMHKIDSFLRETRRLNMSPVAMGRKVAAKDGFTFSDGTTIPYGAMVYVPGTPTHCDNGEASLYVPRHFWSRPPRLPRPVSTIMKDLHKLIYSRFFAATELKAMLAHILINYDVKAETEGFRPPDDRFGVLRMPNLRGKIWIRKRAG